MSFFAKLYLKLTIGSIFCPNASEALRANPSMLCLNQSGFCFCSLPIT